MRLPRRPALFVGAANDAEIAEIALALVRGRWKKWTGDGVPNRLSNLNGRSASHFHREGPRARRTRRPTYRNKAAPP